MLNGGAAALALITAMIATGLGQVPETVVPVRAVVVDEIAYVDLGDGKRGLADAGGTVVAIGGFGRILSASTVADWLLSELAEPGQVLAYTRRSAQGAPWRHRFAGTRTITSVDDLETILGLKPDLVLIESYGDPRRVARLRERGLAVFDLGAMRGVATLVPAIRTIGALLGRAERGDVMARRFARAMDSLAADVPVSERPSAAYVSAYGTQLFGGTKGTTYHDVLRSAGLVDAAAARFEGWPQYSSEDVLAMDPELIVTRTGGGQALCGLAGLERLRACAAAGRIIELDGFALDDPGQGMLEAAETLFTAVHGRAGQKGRKIESRRAP